MSILDRITQKDNKTTQVSTANQLTAEELEFLLNSLKVTTLVGEQVEMFYNLIIKLQNQYLELQK